MKKNNAIFRNEFDYLITDTMPAEMPAPFTFAPFYRWLTDTSLTNGKTMREAINESTLKKGFPENDFASFPHRFLVKKKDGSDRILSCPSIIGATLMTMFVFRFQKDFLYDFSKTSFSIRRHESNSSLVYIGAAGSGKRKAIRYISNFDYTENELLEKTGMFFDIRPMHSLNRLWKSSIWINSWNQFRGESCLHADLERCFPSIYTHTIGWIFPKEGAESKAFNGSNDYHNVLDRVTMRINSNETHGIMVGPEFSRMAAETLLTEIDRRAILELEKKYRFDIDYRVLRFVDDYYIFGKTEAIRQDVLNCIEKHCHSFFLKINRLKVAPILNNDNPVWITSISDALKFWDKTIKGTNASTSKKVLIEQMKYLFSSIRLILSMNEKDSLVAYVFAAFTRMLKSRKTCKKLYSLPCVNYDFYKELFNFLFDVCGNGARFYNIQSLSLMINNIILFSPKGKKKMIVNSLEDVVRSPSVVNWMLKLIGDNGAYDLMPLIFELAAAGVKLPKDVSKALDDLFMSINDPIITACGLLIYNKTGNTKAKSKLLKGIEKDINSFISSFYLDKHFNSAFLFEKIWLIYVFNKCPSINPALQISIDAFLAKIKYYKSSNAVVSLICDYMLDNDYKTFDWDFFSNGSQRKWHYVTNKRTNLIKGDFYQF